MTLRNVISSALMILIGIGIAGWIATSVAAGVTKAFAKVDAAFEQTKNR